MIIVPCALESSLSSVTLPPERQIFDELPLYDETSVTSLTEDMLARASPLKPRVASESKSVIFFSLLVACGKNALRISSFSMPMPLSLT